MSHIIIPQRRIWTRQPQTAQKIKGNHTGVFVNVGAGADVLNGIPLTRYESATDALKIIPNTYGMSVVNDLNGQAYSTKVISIGTRPYTYLALVGGSPSQTSYQYPFALWNNSGYGFGFFNWNNSVPGSGMYETEGTVLTDYSAWPESGLHLVAYTNDESGNRYFYVNGKLIASRTGARYSQPDAALTLGALRNGEGFGSTCPVYYGGVLLDEVWTAPEIRSLAANPWNIYEDRSRHVFVVAGSSSNTYTLSPGGSFTFSGSSSVIKTKQYSPSGSVTFSGTAAELKTKIQVPSGNITYSGTASLTLTNGATEYTITPSGTITFSGTTDYVKERVVYPTGSITYDGSALELKTRSFVPTGNITFSGNNTEYRTKILAPTGLITFQGSAPITGPGGGTGATMTKLPMTGAGK